MDNALAWIEEHPWLAGAIGLGGLLVILWLLGFFSSSSSSSSNQGNSLAAAYYNAEAAQTTAGTQLQMATEAYAAQTAQDQIQANGAEAIASTQANMYTTLGQQNAGTTTALGNDQLLASENSNDDALAASNTAASYAYQTAQAGYNSANYLAYANTIVPTLAPYNQGQVQSFVPGAGNLVSLAVGPNPYNIGDLEAIGYSPAGAAQIAGVPLTSIG